VKKYEIMFIVKPMEEEATNAVFAKFETLIANNGGTVEKVDRWGKKRLAYEIKDFRTGFYYVCVVEANDDKAINEFDRLAKNSNDIIRHLITKLED
jgi:small subunit ribosomal protein S6